MSPAKVSSKMGIFAVEAGDFLDFLSKVADLGVWRLTGIAPNPRKMQGFGTQIDHNHRSSHCLADLEGIELPHSRLRKRL